MRKLKPLRKGLKRLRRRRLRTNKNVGTSKIEKEFGEFLKTEGINLEHQFALGYKFYDFNIKGTNILIEFDGDFYHCNPEIYPEGPKYKHQKKAIVNDLYKNKLAKENDFYLIRIWENDFNKNKSKVLKRIKKLVNEHK